jgi:hypothetical protein
MMYEDKNFAGKRDLLLVGTGEIEQIANLNSYGIGDKVDSLQWEQELIDIDAAELDTWTDKDFKGDLMPLHYRYTRNGLPSINQVEHIPGHPFHGGLQFKWEDVIESLRFRIPVGWGCVLYQDPDYTGRSVTLWGTGFTKRWRNLDSVLFDRPPGTPAVIIGSLNDKVSSLRWVEKA